MSDKINSHICLVLSVYKQSYMVATETIYYKI